MKNKTELVWITPDAERLIVNMARVSSGPSKAKAPDAKLLAYLIAHKHWSPFQMASMCVEVTTGRAISAQLVRHRSLNVQEFSQRYSSDISFQKVGARRQDTKNRQNSIDNLSEEDRSWFATQLSCLNAVSGLLYEEALARGIAKECARFLLPMNTTTKLYIAATLRDWIHYLAVRTDPTTQLEHRQLAEEIQAIFIEQFPVIAEAVFT